MPVRKRARDRPAHTQQRDDFDDESDSSSTVHKKKVRWESNSNAVDGAAEGSNSENDSDTSEKEFH